MSINFRKSAAISRLARFFRSPMRLIATALGLAALGVGGALSGPVAAVLVPGGMLLLLVTFANPLQFMWERLLLAGDLPPRLEGASDTQDRLRHAEEAVNLLAAWIGRVENGLEIATDRPAEVIRSLTDDLRTVERLVAVQAERIEQLERGLRAAERNSELDERLSRAEESLVRLRRTENLALSQGRDLTEAVRMLRADLDTLRDPVSPGGPALTSRFSLLEQRVLALATNVERTVAGASSRPALSGG